MNNIMNRQILYFLARHLIVFHSKLLRKLDHYGSNLNGYQTSYKTNTACCSTRNIFRRCYSPISYPPRYSPKVPYYSYYIYDILLHSFLPPKIRGCSFQNLGKEGGHEKISQNLGGQLKGERVILEKGSFQIVSSGFLQKSMFSLLFKYLTLIM